MSTIIRHFTLRLDANLLRRFEHIARIDDRSANSLLRLLIRNCVSAFEQAHGPIELPEDDHS